MVYIPISAIIYLFSATTCLIYGYRDYQIYRTNNNEYSKLFAYLGFYVAFGLYIQSIPGFIPLSQNIYGIAYLIGSLAIYLGCIKATRTALSAWGANRTEKIIQLVLPLTSILFFAFHLTQIPKPTLDAYGLIHWGVAFPWNVITFVIGTTLPIIPGIFLFSVKAESKKTALKKLLFSVTFICGGLGGWGTVLLQNTFVPLLISYLILFNGFIFLAIMILIDIYMKDQNLKNTKENNTIIK